MLNMLVNKIRSELKEEGKVHWKVNFIKKMMDDDFYFQRSFLQGYVDQMELLFEQNGRAI